MDIYEKVVANVAEQLGISTDDITAETTLEDLDADSLDVGEVIMALESEFHMVIPGEDAEEIKTVGALAEYVQNNY